MPSLYSLVLSLATLSGVIASPDAWSRLWNTCPTDCGNTSSPSDWAVYHRRMQASLALGLIVCIWIISAKLEFNVRGVVG